MSLFTRARRRGRKGFTQPAFWDVDRLRHGLYGMGSSPGRERIETDFEGYVEGIYKRSGPVSALMNVRQLVFSEARFQFQRIRNGRPGDLFGNGDLAILETPWPNGSTGDLLSKLIQYADLAGNAFVVRRGSQLRFMRPDWVTIVATSPSYPDDQMRAGYALDARVTSYIYDPPSGETELLAADQVAHFAPIPDPIADWRGMSWLTPVLREISADTAATVHKLKFFERGASPKIAVKVDPTLTEEKFQRFMAIMQEANEGLDNAYKTMYLGGGADPTVIGADLRQLDFKATQGAGESRLAAAAGVPPVVVGFSEGLAGSSLNAGNYASSRRRFADGTLRPLWRFAAGALASIVPVPADARLWYDDRDIAFLREDRRDAAEIESTKAQSIRTLIDGGFEPDSVVDAINAEDMSRLIHTGYVSVQLQPPGQGGNANAGVTGDDVTPQPPTPPQDAPEGPPPSEGSR